MTTTAQALDDVTDNQRPFWPAVIEADKAILSPDALAKATTLSEVTIQELRTAGSTGDNPTVKVGNIIAVFGDAPELYKPLETLLVSLAKAVYLGTEEAWLEFDRVNEEAKKDAIYTRSLASLIAQHIARTSRNNPEVHG